MKRSLSLSGHRTSVALEPEFWTVLERIAKARGRTLAGLVAALDSERGTTRSLASALRLLALAEAAGAGPVPGSDADQGR